MVWWDMQAHADRRPLLVMRGRIKAGIRAHLEAQGFTEVECAILVPSPGNETHLHAFETRLETPEATSRTLYLHTSPEFAAKKLLAAGEERIFDFARVFRGRERGRLHAPEFTMLEWYRAGADYQQIMDDTLDIMRLAAKTAGAKRLTHRGQSCDPFAPVQKITVAEAFTWFAGIDLMATLDEQGQGVRDALAVRARRGGITVSDDDDWSDIFSKILTARIEPVLGQERPVLLYAYPLCEAALARPCAHDPRLAERFELYACGVELANGFGELTDPVQQRARFEVEMAKKERV
jgi:lysyl-tRNA synthetase class 2